MTQPRRDVGAWGTPNVDVLQRWPTISSQARPPVRPRYRYAARPERLPIQAVVNRHALQQPYTVDIELKDDQGHVDGILRVPDAAGVLGYHGADPNDPAGFSTQVNPRLAVCGALTPYAAARCLARGGAW